MIRTRITCVVAATCAGVAFYDWSFGGLRLRYRLTEFRRAERRAELRTNPPERGDVVMLGDSLIAGGDWERWNQPWRARNFGIDSDQTDHVLQRLAPITEAHPAAICLLIGSNDMCAGRSVADVVKGVVAVVDRIRTEAPDTALIVHTLPPRRDRWAKTVPQINAQIERIARARDLPVVDLFAALADRSGKLPANLSTNKIHFNELGYRRWTESLEEFFPVND